MTRYTLTPMQSASATTRELYEDFLRTTGADRVPIYVQSLGHDPKLLRAYWEKTKGCLVEGRLPMLLKEMVVFVVSRANGAAYCTACHAHAVLRLDPSLSYADLAGLLDDEGAAHLTPAHREALRFAEAMARDANAVTDAQFEALQRAGFSPQDVMELLGVIDLAMMFNAYTSALKLPIDPEYLSATST